MLATGTECGEQCTSDGGEHNVVDRAAGAMRDIRDIGQGYGHDS